MVRQCALTARRVSSNLTGAANKKIIQESVFMDKEERLQLAELLFPNIKNNTEYYE